MTSFLTRFAMRGRLAALHVCPAGRARLPGDTPAPTALDEKEIRLVI